MTHPAPPQAGVPGDRLPPRDGSDRDPHGPYDVHGHHDGAPAARYAGQPVGGGAPSSWERPRASSPQTGSAQASPSQTSPWPSDPWAAPTTGARHGGEQPTAWYGAAPPPQGPGGSAPTDGARPSRQRRGPGWGSLVAVGLVAALVGGGAALGVDALTDRGASTTSAAALAPSSSSSSASGSAGAPATTGAVDWQRVSREVAPSVVAIQVASQAGSGEGSGVVLDDQGRILTNYHVINGAGPGAQLRVVLSDGRVHDDVTVVGEDAATDLAVLQIADPPADLPAATLGDSAAVEVGQPVMAVGNPLGLTDTVTTGIVSALDRPVTTTQQTAQEQPQQQLPFGTSPQQQQTEQVVTNAIQTDAAINPGNSGGALVDASGAVIGINSSIASTGEAAGSIGLGFAIPSDEARRIADELIADGTADHAWLGVSLTDATATADGTTRLAAGIQEVTGGTPAEEAGLRAGDAVTAVDGQPVVGAESLTAQLRERAPGTEVELTVVRDEQQSAVPAVLGTRAVG
ncbi:S1C family serine protease [uncultured Pseudokineococcus sp.]|uniref:S1C family serine protease n=1 Tax=uncultured Pseudokineococcus sp. TaxID=1642928 RepID=UPI002634A5FA|nr:trypsin-like peptidase domain-containing protein [uncultured Pseudokineococcus sp.]